MLLEADFHWFAACICEDAEQIQIFLLLCIIIRINGMQVKNGNDYIYIRKIILIIPKCQVICYNISLYQTHFIGIQRKAETLKIKDF